MIINDNKIKVGFGSLEPPNEPGYWLHVISKSSDCMDLKDYGFIDKLGKLLSLPQLWEDEGEIGESVYFRGNPFFDQQGDLFENGPYFFRDEQIGAFAITTGQKRHILVFRNDVPLLKRLWIRFKVWWKPKYQ